MGNRKNKLRWIPCPICGGRTQIEELTADYIIPAAFDPRMKDAVAKPVAEAARKSEVARI